MYQFLPIFTEKTIDGAIKDVIITAFYWIVLKMINFWDNIYFEKIDYVYNSDYEFQKEELKELAFEYHRALHKVKMSK